MIIACSLVTPVCRTKKEKWEQIKTRITARSDPTLGGHQHVDQQRRHDRHGQSRVDVFMALPLEVHQEGTGCMLQKAQTWEREYNNTLTDFGFTVEGSSACIFRNSELDMELVGRGDGRLLGVGQL